MSGIAGPAERVVIAGGGIAGLAAAIGLARAGRGVTVVDRDPLIAADCPDSAFAIDRRGAPQARHTHGLLARLTTVLRERYPDVLETLVEAGGVEVDLGGRFPDEQDGDERLRVLLARRTTLEWALRRAAAAEPGIELRGGEEVKSLIGSEGHVDGTTLTGGSVRSAIVVAAGGRRCDVHGWLRPLGVQIPEEQHDTGIVYLTRWYKASERWDRVMGGEELVKLGGDLGYLFYLAVPADSGTFSLTMAIGARDSSLRSRLLSEPGFDRAAAALPLPDGLLDRLVADGPVYPMGGLVNRIRRFLSADGRPLVTGFHAAGDAHTCTNPIYGRGCSLALVQAVELVDAIIAHPDDPIARAVAYEAGCRAQTEPWYRLSVDGDEARRRRAEGAELGEPDSPSPIELLFSVGSDDPVVGRAILRAVNLLSTPQQLMTEPAVVGRAMELASANAANGAPANRWTKSGPSRQEMLDLTAA